MDGDEFPDVIAFAYFDKRRLTAVFQILRRKPDGNKRKNMCVVIDDCFTIDDNVGIETHTVAQCDLFADD